MESVETDNRVGGSGEEEDGHLRSERRPYVDTFTLRLDGVHPFCDPMSPQEKGFEPLLTRGVLEFSVAPISVEATEGECRCGKRTNLEVYQA